MKRNKTSVFFLWFVFISGMIYFFLPLYATFDFSLRMLKDRLSFEAYKAVFGDPGFYSNFGYSLMWSLLTVSICLLLFTWTAYWMHLRLPNWRPYVEFITLLPFVVPAVVLIFGLIRIYSQVGFIISTPSILIATYVVMAMPYMFRSIDAGLRAIDVRTFNRSGAVPGSQPQQNPVPDHLPQFTGQPAERDVPDLCHRDRRVHSCFAVRMAILWRVHSLLSGYEGL